MSLARIQDQSLIRDQAFVGGEWIESKKRESYDVANPATGESIARVPLMGAQEAREAISKAAESFPSWQALTAKERALLLHRWYELQIVHKEDLALLITLEQGKPLAEARGEVAYAGAFTEWYAEEGKRAYGDIIPTHRKNSRILILKQPVGVIAAITPWNFPAAMITRKVAPALAAGCTVVCKPAEATPLTAFALAFLAQKAGIPPGVFNVISGNPEEIGAEFTANTTVRQVSFTGSTRVGRLLMEQCSPTVKRLSLELGGQAPFIVFEDADLDQAVEGAIASKYRNNGQTCICANRFLVQESIHDQFAERLIKASEKLQVGNGLEEGSQIGPLINQAALQKVERHVADALKKGAKLLTGGKSHSLGGTFFEPTVVSDANSSMLLAQEETFGPVSPLFRFKTEEEAIQMANDTEYGLAAYFYSRDVGRVWRVAEALEYGVVGINEGIVSTENAPFGGFKQSGLGREGSYHGIEEYLETKYVCMGGI